MNDQLLHRILIINIDDLQKLLGIINTKPCLDRYLKRTLLIDFPQKTVQRHRPCQKAGAFPLGHHGSCRAAKI